MADNDNRSILQVTADEEGKPSLQSLNEILRQIQMNSHKLEGRLGESTVRDDLRVMGKEILEGQTTQVGETGSGVIYYDSALAKFRASQNGGAMGDLLYIAPAIGCKIYNSANQVITTSNTTSLTFDSEEYDTDNMHSTTSNTSRITFNTAGVYLVGGATTGDLATNGWQMRLQMNGNGAQYILRILPETTGTDTFGITMRKFVVGDYLEYRVTHSHGSDRSVLAASGGVDRFSPIFWAQYLSA